VEFSDHLSFFSGIYHHPTLRLPLRHPWRLAVGHSDQCLTGRRSHSLTSWLPSSWTPVVIAEPLPDRPGPLQHMSKEMGSNRQ